MADTTNNTSGRKRRRKDSNDPNAPKYPDIPGVPIDVIPLFVHAIKMSTKYFTHTTATCRAPYSEDNGNNNDTAGIEAINGEAMTTTATAEASSSSTVMTNLMDRIEATADSARTNEEYILRQQQQRERQTKMDSAIEAWLEVVKRYARNENRARELQQEQKEEASREATTNGGNGINSNNGAATQNKERPSVALSCFLYAWGLQLEHGKIAPRRAALHLCGLLLEKSRDCRFHLAQDENLSAWIKVVTTALDQTSCWTNLEQATQQIPYWQRESEMLLSFLVEERGYDALYPKFGVALIRFRQLLPTTVSTTSTNGNDDTNYSGGSNGNMFVWRRSRDIALRDGRKEIKRAKKLIQRVYGCMDILVPRMGRENDAARRSSGEIGWKSSEQGSGVDVVDHDDDYDEHDDDDIDWEDGEDDAEDTDLTGKSDPNENESADQKQPPAESHADAVERTLATMEASGGLRGGELEIEFGQREGMTTDTPENHVRQQHLHVLPPPLATTEPTDSINNEEHLKTLKALEKYFKLLNDRHMPRLSAWVEGLTNADNLKMLSSNGSSAALVSLGGDTIRKRHDILELLVDLKKTLASVLSSAMRLLRVDAATAATEETRTTNSETGTGDGTQQADNDNGIPPPIRRQQISLGSAANLTGAQRNSSLLTSFQRHRRRNRSSKNSRSGRIQIKYRSS